MPLTVDSIFHSASIRGLARVYTKSGQLVDHEQVRQAIKLNEIKKYNIWKWIKENAKPGSKDPNTISLDISEGNVIKWAILYSSNVNLNSILEPGTDAELKYGGPAQNNLCFFIRDTSLLTKRGMFGSAKMISRELLGCWLQIYENEAAKED